MIPSLRYIHCEHCGEVSFQSCFLYLFLIHIHAYLLSIFCHWYFKWVLGLLITTYLWPFISCVRSNSYNSISLWWLSFLAEPSLIQNMLLKHVRSEFQNWLPHLDILYRRILRHWTVCSKKAPGFFKSHPLTITFNIY